MPTKARAKMLKDTYEEKTRFKLYKKGHTWAIAGLTLLFSGVLATQQVQVTHAATTDADVNTSTNGIDTTKSSTVTLTPSTVATIGDQALTVGGDYAMPSVTMAQGEVAPDWTMSDFDFTKVDTTQAGTYTVSLSASGLAKLQAANPTQTITASNAVAGTVTVKAAAAATALTTPATTATAETTSAPAATAKTTATPQVKTQVDAQEAISATVGNATKAYDGKTDNPATVTVTLGDGATAPSDWYYTGTANTYQVNTANGDVTMSADGTIGTSAITLSAQGIAALKAANPKASVSASNVTAGTLTITQKSVAAGSITIADQSKKHDGNATTDPTTYNVTLPDGITAPSTWAQNADGTYALTTTAGDISVADDASQNIGTYAVNLSAQALAALQAANPTLAITASSIAPATYTIENTGTISVGSTTISQDKTALPDTLTVAVSNGLNVPSDWQWSYQGPNEMEYALPINTDNFDLDQVKLGTIGSYEISLSDAVKAELQALNPDVKLTDDLYSNGQVIITQQATSANKYTPSWLIAQVKGMYFDWNNDPSDISGTMVVGEPYQYQVSLYSNGGDHSDPIYDGLTEYVILPSGFEVAEAAGSSTLSTDPAQTIQDIINEALEPAKVQGFKNVTVTQLADYQGRQTFKIVLHTDGTNKGLDFSQATADLLISIVKDENGEDVEEVQGPNTRGVFEIPIVVNASVAGTTVSMDGGPGDSDTNVVYITDDPAVTDNNYSLGLYGYGNVTSVASFLGVSNANGLQDGALGGPYNVEVVQANVEQKFNLVDSTGNTIQTTANPTVIGAPGSTYSPSEVLPNTITDENGVTYYLATDQLADKATLNPGVGEEINRDTMIVEAAPVDVLYRTVLANGSVTVDTNTKGYDGISSNPTQYKVTLAAGLTAPSEWVKSDTENEYLVPADEMDLDGVTAQTAGSYTITLNDAGLAKLAAANPNVFLSRDAVTPGTLNIVATVTVNYVYPAGTDTASLSASQSKDITATDEAFTIGKADSDFIVPTLKGYDATVTDANNKAQSLTDEPLELKSDGTNQTYTITYEKQPLIPSTKTVTKTVIYVDNVDTPLHDPFVTSVTFNVTTDPVTGAVTYTPGSAVLGAQALPDIPGYYVYSYKPYADTPQTIYYGDGDVNATYKVVYRKLDVVGTYTITKTVHYMDRQGNTLAPDYTDSTTFTQYQNPFTKEFSFDQATATLGHQDDPIIKGYHLIESPVEATADQTVAYNDPTATYTYNVIYAKDAPTVESDTVTKTVQYVDEAGNTLAPDYTDSVTIDQNTDAATGEVTYDPESASLGHQDNPTIKGYHVVTSPAEATTDQTVKFGDADTTYKVVYAKDAPTVESDTVSKTVHYVDEAGNPLATDYTDTATLTQSTDAATGVKTYDPATATLGHQANPTIKGYHVVVSPAEATTDQTVKFGDADATYKVVYAKDAPQVNQDTITKTVHYVDEDGKTIATDFTATATLTQSTDAVTGEKTYDPATATLGHQANPTIKGYHVITSPDEATADQTVKFGDADTTYKVVYAKDAPTVESDTVSKTVHYVDQDGKAIAPDYTDNAAFTQSTDAATGVKTYNPVSAILGHQANPTINGYHVVESPAEATSDQTVEFGYADESYTVVYNKNTPAFGMDTVTKTVHYVDQDGNAIAPDYTTHANFTEVTDPVTGQKSYGPEMATLGYQANPTVNGYHVVTSPAVATTAQTVKYGDADGDITVVYNKNTPAFGMDTVSKTVHYVDQNGNTLAPDYTTHANFTEITDPVTGVKSYGPESATLGYQAAPTIAGYHIVTNPAEATSAQTVKYGDADTSYTVVYAKDAATDNGGTTTNPSGNTSTTTPHGTLPDTSVGEPSNTTTATTAVTASATPQRTTLPATDAEASARAQLPQTGDQHESILAILGVSLLSLLGIAGLRRKRNE
ncbi:mucin-binding protein [Lacticaseibacillus porcinae]|uniref:mucin-binding protein n=1 Tax=Lacticaseibacillus porcinae TaxID=1123687 RepID=UPI0013DE1D49|nr:MBG domain-containing protein [Lacticaseibacillus porcinae]